MAAPILAGTNAAQTQGTGAGVAAWPAGHQPDDIGILVVQSANQTVATPSGWTLLGNVGTGTPGAIGATAVWVFWRRATSAAESDATIADPGDHFRARMYTFSGCETSGSPFDGSVVTGTVATPQTDVSIAMPTTTVADCYAVGIVANGTDSGSNQTAIGTQTWANTALSGFTRIMTGNTANGVGGGADGGGGTKAVAGAIGNSTTVLVTASAQALLSFALKPPQGAPPATTPTEGGIYVATGGKATIGATGATTATLDAAAVQARITIALKPEVSAPANTPPVLEAVPQIVGAVGNLVTFPVEVTDLEGDGITLSLEAGNTEVPTGAVLVEDEASGNFAFEWTPTTDQVGDWAFFLRATDDNVSPLSSTTPVLITVRSGPVRPPFGVATGAVTSIS
jgi:hypothetical protein